MHGNGERRRREHDLQTTPRRSPSASSSSSIPVLLPWPTRSRHERRERRSGGGIAVNVISKLVSGGTLRLQGHGRPAPRLREPGREPSAAWRAWPSSAGSGRPCFLRACGVFLERPAPLLRHLPGLRARPGQSRRDRPLRHGSCRSSPPRPVTRSVSALLGATAPAWALMAGATLFGVAANLINPQEGGHRSRTRTRSRRWWPTTASSGSRRRGERPRPSAPLSSGSIAEWDEARGASATPNSSRRFASGFGRSDREAAGLSEEARETRARLHRRGRPAN